MGIAVGVEQAGGGGEQVADTVHIDAAPFHHNAGFEKLQGGVALGKVVEDMQGDLRVEFVGVFAAPGVVVPVDDGMECRVLPVEEVSGAMVAAPGVVGGKLVEEDASHVASNLLQLFGHMVLHTLVVHIDVYLFVLGQGLDEDMVRGEDGLNLARPGVLVVGIAEPGGTVFRPFSGHIVS